MYISDNPLFRSLSNEEEEEFRQYARENDPPNIQLWDIYHPICRDEWERRGIKSLAEQRIDYLIS